MTEDPPEETAEARLPFAMWVPVGRAVIVAGMTAVAGAAAAAGAVAVPGPGAAATCSLTPLPFSVAHADRAIVLRTTPEKTTLREKRLNILKTYLDQPISDSSNFVAQSEKRQPPAHGSSPYVRTGKQIKQIIIHQQPSRMPRNAIDGEGRFA